MSKIYTAFLDSPTGILKLETDDSSILSITFSNTMGENSPNHPQILKDCSEQLTQYFLGQLWVFNLKLKPKGTPFQKKVWAELEGIPFGKTVSYLEIARQLGDPKVIRAAASANGKNPISIIIPCHRVIGVNGDLTGYAGGLSRKKWLLDHENRLANGVLELF